MVKPSFLVGILAAIASAAPLDVGSLLLAPLVEHEDPIPGQYMISFKDGHQLGSHENFLGRSLGSLIRQNWDEEHAWAPYGYSAALDDALLALVRADPMIDFVEQDYYVQTVENEPAANVTGGVADQSAALDKRSPTAQRNANFNLVIASANGKRTGTAKGSFDYDTAASGTGVDIYIADSGINTAHVDFAGRASNFFDATETTFYDDSSIGGVRGHGTEVASIAAGTTSGIAKTANLLSVKIVSGANNAGRGSDAVTAIKRITRRHNTRSGQSGFRDSVVNYSVNIPVPAQNKASLGQAISAADAQNIIQVAAAGNSNNEAVNQLPAAYTAVITVASMTPQYKLSPSTSYGTAVDILAPGTGISAAAADSNKGYYSVSGTSFAAPLVAGVCAQFLSYAQGPRTKSDLYNMLIDFSVKDQVDLTGGPRTPNRVVNNGANTRSWPERGELRV